MRSPSSTEISVLVTLASHSFPCHSTGIGPGGRVGGAVTGGFVVGGMGTGGIVVGEIVVGDIVVGEIVVGGAETGPGLSFLLPPPHPQQAIDAGTSVPS